MSPSSATTSERARATIAAANLDRELRPRHCHAARCAAARSSSGSKGKYVGAGRRLLGPAQPRWAWTIPELGRLRGDFSSPIRPRKVARAWLASATCLRSTSTAPPARASSPPAACSVTGSAAKPATRRTKTSRCDVAFKGYPRAGCGRPAGATRSRFASKTRPTPASTWRCLRGSGTIAEREPNVAAVVLELRASPAESMAHAQELRDALFITCASRQARALSPRRRRRRGAVPVLGGANESWSTLAGGFASPGSAVALLLLRRLLEKLGIRADFVRIGDHKSAPESFMRDGSTDVARADKIDLLQQIRATLHPRRRARPSTSSRTCSASASPHGPVPGAGSQGRRSGRWLRLRRRTREGDLEPASAEK